MNLDLFFSATTPIPSHAIMALLALVVGIAQLSLPKGTVQHRATGYLWVVLMAFVAGTGFFVHELRMIGPFSIVHAISIYVLYGLYNGVMAARRGEVERHQSAMKQLYCWGLLLAGAFTLFPGRHMYKVLFQ